MQLPTTLDLHPSDIILITGPSGSGKTSSVPLIRRLLPPETRISTSSTHADHVQVTVRQADDTVVAVHKHDMTTPIIDAWPIDIHDRLARLSMVGLADAYTWARSINELSDGQHARMEFALAYWTENDMVYCDEWLAKLDRVTARAVAWSTARTLRSFGVGAILITSHDDLTPDLSPDIHIEVGWSPTPVIHHRTHSIDRCSIHPEITYDRADVKAWRALKHLHYAAGDPATVHSYHALRHPRLTQPAAVAVLSYPDLHSTGRNVATKHAYQVTGDRRTATRLNREVLKLSRIVVTPELRGLGLARRLINELVAAVHPRWLECVTAMGRYSSFLGSCGFAEVPQESSPPEAKLLNFIQSVQMPDEAALTVEAYAAWIDTLSVRNARTARRLTWHYYHHFVIHRRTRAQKPGRIPGPSDPRWPDAFDVATRRIWERPSYWILGPLDPQTGQIDPDWSPDAYDNDPTFDAAAELGGDPGHAA